MTGDRVPLLVLGLGNILCGDDGAGVEAVDRLSHRWELADGVRVLDGGTLGLALLPYLRSAEHVILVDAVLTGQAAGTIVRFDGEEVFSVARGRMSCHQVGVADVLDCARLLGDAPPVTLVGIAASNVSAMAPPSEEVSARIDALVERVVAEIRALGFGAERRDSAPSGSFETAEESPHDRQAGDSTDRSRGRVGVLGSV